VGQLGYGSVWHVRLNPALLGANINRALNPLMEWCETQWGPRGMQWNRSSSVFDFKHREQAMMFKLAWHGVEL
jgi:hypothetical protein